jgi:hypothetical protein
MDASHSREMVPLLADKWLAMLSARPLIRKMASTIKVDIVSDTICPWYVPLVIFSLYISI